MKKEQIPYRLKTYITLRDEGMCQICGKRGKIKPHFGCYRIAFEKIDGEDVAFEVGHIDPECLGGRLIAENLLLLCRRCNRTLGWTNAIPNHTLDKVRKKTIK